MKFFVFLVLLALAGAVCAAGTRGVEDLTNLERLAKVKAALPGATAALEKAQAEATAARKAFTALREGLRPHLDRAPETVRAAVKTFLRTKSRHERAKLMAAWHTAQATKSDVTSTGFSALADAAEKTGAFWR
jgi:outer membrane protein TolC